MWSGMGNTSMIQSEVKRFEPSPEANELLDRMAERRKAAIEYALSTLAESKSGPIDAVMAAVLVDMEHSPTSTNRKMLEMIGIELPACSDEVDDASVDDVTRNVISGLATWNVYVLGTDSIDDRTLLKVLLEKVLADEVRLIPPSAGVVEIIDLHVDDLPTVADRDRFFPKPSRMVDLSAIDG